MNKGYLKSLRSTTADRKSSIDSWSCARFQLMLRDPNVSEPCELRALAHAGGFESQDAQRRVNSAAAAALLDDDRQRDWTLVPISAGEKRPIVRGWQERDWRPADFRPGLNVAIILGPRSGHVVDVDLDCAEALALADLYLPPTGTIFGRQSKRGAHRLYTSPGAVLTTFADPLDGQMLVKLRAPGKGGGAHTTLLPLSVTNGEPREWEGETIAPALVKPGILHQRCAWLAAGCLVMRHISETAARKPGWDFPRLLYEANPKLGRGACRWFGLPDPDAPKYLPKRRCDLTATEVSLWDMAEAIPNNGLSWDEWNAFGLAFFAASKGSDEGFIAFDRFSAKSSKYDGDETRARWRNYRRSRPTNTGFGKLIAAAVAAGWRPPQPQLVQQERRYA